MRFFSPLATLIIAVSTQVAAHTWVEQLNRIAPNGTLLLPDGFPPKWFGRGEGFRDELFTNLLTEADYRLCARQPLGEQVEGFPMLEAGPGDFVALRYQENGHVTLPDNTPNKPLNRGSIYIYGTSSPTASDTLFDVFKRWNPDGTGGDGRGRLLATRHYDDGQCFQVNDGKISVARQKMFRKVAADPQGADLWCQADVQLPNDLTAGTIYSIYFVWTWPTLRQEAVAASGSGGYGDFPTQGSPSEAAYLAADEVIKSEIYSSCSSIRIINPNPLPQGNAFNKSQDVNYVSIQDQLRHSFLVHSSRG